MAKKKNTKPKQVETTGHEWDGIKELNTPLPRWWVWIFLATIVYSIGYMVYYPSWPTSNGFIKGIGNWSQYNELKNSLNAANTAKAPFETKIAMATLEQINADESIRDYAIESGRAEFALSCSQCHGAGAAGTKGYANLLDDEWIWGGSLNAIAQTITYGIRDVNNEDTRLGDMAAFGQDEILTKNQIADVARYLKTLSENYLANDAADRGELIYAENCAACHGDKGEGVQEFGAPPLNNPIWLYGGSTPELIETITNGRAAQMPGFGHKFDENTIKKLTIFVHSLSGGE